GGGEREGVATEGVTTLGDQPAGGQVKPEISVTDRERGNKEDEGEDEGGQDPVHPASPAGALRGGPGLPGGAVVSGGDGRRRKGDGGEVRGSRLGGCHAREAPGREDGENVKATPLQARCPCGQGQAEAAGRAACSTGFLLPP